jgi:hypothetical protein
MNYIKYIPLFANQNTQINLTNWLVSNSGGRCDGGGAYSIPYQLEHDVINTINKEYFIFDGLVLLASSSLLKNNFLDDITNNVILFGEDCIITTPTLPCHADIYSFNYALQVSNTKYIKTFSDLQTKYPNHKFLNVIRGNNCSEIKNWYGRVKKYNNFHGYAIECYGIKEYFLYAIALLVDNNEFNRDNFNYLHFFNIERTDDILLLILLNRTLHEKYGDKIAISFSNYMLDEYEVHGAYLNDIQHLGTMQFNVDEKDIDLASNLPCLIDCEMCSNTKYKDIMNVEQNRGKSFLPHNFWIYLTHIRETSNYTNNIRLKEMFKYDKKLAIYYSLLSDYVNGSFKAASYFNRYLTKTKHII